MCVTRLMRFRAVAVDTVLAMSAAVAACSGNDDPSSATSNGDTREAVQQASAAIADFLDAPSGIGIDQPLSATPPTGVEVGVVACNVQGCTVFLEAVEAAAARLGWTTKSYVTTGAPEDLQAQFTRAVEAAPDAIITSGFGRAAFGPALEAAAKAGIPVVNSAVTDDVADPYIAIPAGVPVFERSGTMIGNWIIEDSGGEANVLIMSSEIFEILAVGATATQNTLEEGCPGCSVSVQSFQPADIGTRLPSAVVAEIQRDPEIGYVVFQDGAMSLGVAEALAAAGIGDDVKIAGIVVEGNNLEALRNGTEHAWVGFSSTWQAWAAVDALARQTIGDEQLELPLASPAQLITQDNIADVATTGEQWTVPGYEDEFAALWQVG